MEKPVSGDSVDNGGALVEDEKHGRKHCQGAVDKNQNGQLRQVCKGEHASNDADRKGYIGPEARDEGLPKRAVRGEVEDALGMLEAGSTCARLALP